MPSTGASPATDLRGRLTAALQRAGEVEAALADPATSRDSSRLRALGREHARLEPIVRKGRRWEQLVANLAQARELAAGADPELAELARAEIAQIQSELPALEAELDELLTPHDPLDDRDAIVEIRAGTGGDEAALFAAELFRMYQRYADRRGWRTEVIEYSEGALNGVKEVVFAVRGENAYGDLRSEAGVHRVQRVPVTESAGRIHTSAATVAVLPEAEEVDVEIEEKDLRIDVFRSQGPGGQSVNTTDSAVRITHVPTGLVVQCQDQKSQLQNKIKALEVLRSRLLDRMIAEQEAARARERRAMVGTGDRSAKIRTYNFPQSRVTDHRIGLSVYNLQELLDGRLDELVKALKLARREERKAAEIGVAG
ncbi:MAG TPA: peptide chain release factor 1 [Gemmatimonadales bacterium]|nr:peptide chain release factor 1 [Gemmatimonadales bacterium]